MGLTVDTRRGLLVGGLDETEDLAVLLVEQHVAKVLGVADRVYVMQRGSIVMSGTADEIRGRLDDVQLSYLAGDAP